MDILKAIYNGEYHIEHQMTKEYQTAWRKNTELINKLLPAADLAAIDQLNASYAAMAEIENYEHFLAGLRLGMAVMWEFCR